jgi:iron(III) transport system substrate-binding protein
VSRSFASLRITFSIWVAVLSCGGSSGKTVLTVYSPHGKDLLEYYERAFERTDSTVDVQWVDMGSQEILDRLRAEAANPQADLWFGAPAEIFERAAKEGLLAAYRPTWGSALPNDARDPNDLWYGTYLTPEVIAYNSEAVSDAEAPKDWDDVLDPKWRDKVIIRDPIASGTMRAIFGAIIARELARTGSTRAGYDWLLRLDANTKEYTLNPTILYQKLGRQEGVVTLYNMPDMATLQQRTRIPVKWVVPASGTPVLVEGIAIVKGAKQPEIAKRFYELVTSKHALHTAATDFLRIPARTDLSADSLPAWIRDAKQTMKTMPVDRQLLADSLDVWMRYWDANIRNRGKRS